MAVNSLATMHYAICWFLLTMMTGNSESTVDITNLRLRKLLDTSYNKERAPVSLEGAPVIVTISLHIREMTLDDNDFIMSLDSVDVIQSWVDPRLAAVTHDARDLDLYKSQVDLVWKPDILVVNGRRQSTADHKTLTLSKSGQVTFQQRLTVDALCPNFTSHMKPLVCSVQFQPSGNPESELLYQWGSVTVDQELAIPKYSLVKLETAVCPKKPTPGARYSCRQLSLSFDAHVNFFATEVYGASVLLVALSWTGFWVGSRPTAENSLGRICLGLVIVLILVVYGIGFRLLHNKVGVPGNVEVWVAFCTLFVLASLIEYAFVHVLLRTVASQVRRVCCKRRSSISVASTMTSLPPSPSCINDISTISSRTFNDYSYNGNTKYNEDISTSNYQKAVRVIDVTCGILFPIIFVLFNVAYWLTY